MRVLVFGASITQGYWDTQGGWANRLRRHYDERQVKDLKNNDEPSIFNLGISGDTTRGVLKRLRNETEARVWPGDELAFIFSIGTNNAIIKNDGSNLAEPEEYANDLQKVIDEAKNFSSKILFVELPPCDDKLTHPVFWTDISYSNERIALFNEAMHSVAKRNSVPYVKIYEELSKRLNAGEEILPDGVHPNDKGHEIMFELILPEFDKLLRAK